MNFTKIEDVKVLIDLSKQNHSKGFLANAKIQVPLQDKNGNCFFITTKGFVVKPTSENAEYKADGVRGYCWIAFPSTLTKTRKWVNTTFIEDGKGKPALEPFAEFSQHILRAYYKRTGHIPPEVDKSTTQHTHST